MSPAAVLVGAGAGAAAVLIAVAVGTPRHDARLWHTAWTAGENAGRADLRRRLDVWHDAEPDMPLADVLLQLDLARANPDHGRATPPDLDAIFPLDPEDNR